MPTLTYCRAAFLKEHQVLTFIYNVFNLRDTEVAICIKCMLATRIPVFSLVLRVIFPELLTSGQLYYSDVMILFDLYIIFELFLKL
jgi:hypothetical protein